MKHNWRLTTAEKCEGVRRYQRGECRKAIAADLGVTPSTVRCWARTRGLPGRHALPALRRKHRYLSASPS